MKVSVLLLMVLGLACTKPNPATCCLDPADCAANGFDEIRQCAPGLACVNHECEVPKCSTTGCTADLPVCNIVTDVCEGCIDESSCSRFAAMPACDAATGACVECVTEADCTTPTRAFCDNRTCRGCSTDAECVSGACGDDGACIPESAAVYMSPDGVDLGTCSSAAPCRTFTYAVTQTAIARSHIVMAKGGYVMSTTRITATAARPLYVHGAGSALSQSGEGLFLGFEVGVVLRDLELSSSGNTLVLSGPDPSVLERIKVHSGFYGILVNTPTTARDIFVENAAYGIGVTNSQLVLERATIKNNESGLIADGTASLNATNVLIFGSRLRAIEWGTGTGTVAFSTIVDSGSAVASGARGVLCGSAMTLRSSIVWTPGAGALPPFENCATVNTIAGPVAVPGATNVEPAFVNASAQDYHLTTASPARDVVDTGPATDFEDDPRPRGARFDIGADEAP